MKQTVTSNFLKNSLLALMLLFVGSNYGSAQNPAPAGGHSPISVVVQIRGSHLIYWVNGKIANDPLRTLETLWNAKSNDVVDIMIDPHATFLQLGEVEGLIGKAGFQRVNAFVYSRESGMREKILRNPPERYPAKP
jgi:biopolymer transport protein ExbD